MQLRSIQLLTQDSIVKPCSRKNSSVKHLSRGTEACQLSLSQLPTEYKKIPVPPDVLHCLTLVPTSCVSFTLNIPFSHGSSANKSEAIFVPTDFAVATQKSSAKSGQFLIGDQAEDASVFTISGRISILLCLLFSGKQIIRVKVCQATVYEGTCGPSSAALSTPTRVDTYKYNHYFFLEASCLK